ncbi:MAG: family 43 glycosylhydrolase, partial [Bacillales bacterium]|nr:family 43 glycosylhydrolase [Bacillales bacterium]
MKIMKKTLALSLVFLFTLVSCKKTESSSSVDSSSPTTSSVISSSVSYASDVDKTPTLSPSTVSFDKYSPNDVHFSLNTFNEAITSVKEGQTTITYTYEGGTLTLGQSLFIDKDLGTYTITVTTSQGVATATVTVIDTTPSTVWTRPDYDVSYFNNKDFHAYGGNLGTIPGQWNGYGIGDPFVMRFNGTYYLYASTLDSENGIRAWHSADLINWSKVQAEGLPEGYVVSLDDYTSRAAYAPEVYYYNGTFYLYTSPGGSGHYVYTATAPEGPFIRATDNFGLSIDGSVLIDDDEQMYFTRANSGDIRIHRMDDMLSVRSASLALDNTNLGGWTEGSYILKRDGYYYLTYTGNHVASDGYRVSYSYSQANNIYDRNAFTYGVDLPILLNTTDVDVKGVGHSSTVLGPDLDSHYIVYHNLNNSGGPNRS